MKTDYEIIDFHTHPFTDSDNNICQHQTYCDMSAENTVTYLKSLGISRMCGSVICRNRNDEDDHYNTYWEMVADSNKKALIPDFRASETRVRK